MLQQLWNYNSNVQHNCKTTCTVAVSILVPFHTQSLLWIKQVCWSLQPGNKNSGENSTPLTFAACQGRYITATATPAHEFWKKVNNKKKKIRTTHYFHKYQCSGVSPQHIQAQRQADDRRRERGGSGCGFGSGVSGRFRHLSAGSQPPTLSQPPRLRQTKQAGRGGIPPESCIPLPHTPPPPAPPPNRLDRCSSNHSQQTCAAFKERGTNQDHTCGACVSVLNAMHCWVIQSETLS